MALIGSFCRPSMKTLDKKISVSSDQLDTLTTEQRADKFAQVADDDGGNGDGDVGGDGDGGGYGDVDGDGEGDGDDNSDKTSPTGEGTRGEQQKNRRLSGDWVPAPAACE